MFNNRLFRSFIVAVLCAPLVACVTQKYGDQNTPIVERTSSDKELATTRITLALAHLRNGNTSQAKLNLELAKKHAPNFVDVYTSFAHYYEHVGEFQLAENAYREALSINAKDPDTLNNFGVYYCRRNRLDKAEEVFLQAIAVPSYIRVSESYENLAVCHLKSHSFKRAEVFLDKAIMHSPNSLSSLYLMAQLQYAKGDIRQGINVLKRYEMASSRIAPEMLALSYKLFKAKGDKVKAQEYLGILLTLHPKSAQAMAYIKNELTETDTDKLRRAYLEQQAVSTPKVKSRKKKTLVLKPKTNEGLMVLPEQPKQQRYTVEQSLLQPKKTVEKPVATNGEQGDIVPLSLPIHLIAEGDSLSVIASKYRLSVNELMRWNGLSNANSLQVGAVLYLANPKDLVKSAQAAPQVKQ